MKSATGSNVGKKTPRPQSGLFFIELLAVSSVQLSPHSGGAKRAKQADPDPILLNTRCNRSTSKEPIMLTKMSYKKALK